MTGACASSPRATRARSVAARASDSGRRGRAARAMRGADAGPSCLAPRDAFIATVPISVKVVGDADSKNAEDRSDGLARRSPSRAARRRPAAPRATDRDLIAACVGGDGEAARDLHVRYHAVASAFLRKLGTRPGELEDACQEVFLRFFRYLPSFRGEAELKTWLYRLCITEARRARRRRRIGRVLEVLLVQRRSDDERAGPGRRRAATPRWRVCAAPRSTGWARGCGWSSSSTRWRGCRASRSPRSPAVPRRPSGAGCTTHAACFARRSTRTPARARCPRSRAATRAREEARSEA